MSDEIKRLRKVLDGATAGPWEAQRLGSWDDSEAVVATDWGKGSHGCRVISTPPRTHPMAQDGSVNDDDARAIAALGTLWPALLAVAESQVQGGTYCLYCGGCNGAHDEEFGNACPSARLNAAIREHLGEP